LSVTFAIIFDGISLVAMVVDKIVNNSLEWDRSVGERKVREKFTGGCALLSIGGRRK
jgi:hypothetical protein